MREWLLIEVHGSWGCDAVHDSELGPHAPEAWRAAMRARGVRVITIRRGLETHHYDRTRASRLVHVVAGRPGSTRAMAQQTVIEDLHQVVTATEWLTSGDDGGPGWVADRELYALVCTNGRHDPCCAVLGRPLARGLRESRWANEVWECSHIGGDRFAGNLALLPESLYFGRCHVAAAEHVLSRYHEGRLDLTHFRGRSTSSLAEQAAEHFLRCELALDAIDAVTGVESLGGGRVRLRIDPDDQAFVVSIERTRTPAETPLTCRGCDGLTYPSFHLLAIEPERPPASPRDRILYTGES